MQYVLSLPSTKVVSGTASVTLASSAATDTIVVGDAGMGVTSITNFQTAGVDQIELDISLIGVITTVNDINVSNATATDIVEVTAANQTLTTTDNILIFSDIHSQLRPLLRRQFKLEVYVN